MGKKKPNNQPPNFSQVCCIPCLGLVWSKKPASAATSRGYTHQKTNSVEVEKRVGKGDWGGEEERRRRGEEEEGGRGCVGGKDIEIRKGKEN